MPKSFIQTPSVRKLLPLSLSVVLTLSALAVSAGVSVDAKPATKRYHHAQPVKSPAKPSDAKKSEKDSDKQPVATAAEIDASIASAQAVDPLALMKDPAQFLNKKVTFTGTFNRFADIALDYKKAFRDSRDYVTFFILRPDVKEHTIPMAEMKLFFPRKKSDEAMDLEPGDKIQLVGTEFSTALDEPWIDVEHIKILEKLPRPDKKHEAPEF